MEENTDTDADFESAEEGSEYFSVTDGGDEMQFQQLNWDNGDSGKESKDRSVGGSGDIAVETLSDTNPSRRSTRFRIRKRKEDLPPENTISFEQLKKSKVGKIKFYKRRTNSIDYLEPSTRHHRLHSRKKSHNCPTSHKRHVRIYTGEKPYHCVTCSKSFSSSSALKMHDRVHTGEKPYQCVTCSKSFCNLSDLKRHYRVHTGERPYQCVTCSKSFSDSSALKKHDRVHTGEKPYQCVICSKSFSDSSALKKHDRVHTGEKPYQCVICSKSFSQLSCLKKHIVDMHK